MKQENIIWLSKCCNANCKALVRTSEDFDYKCSDCGQVSEFERVVVVGKHNNET